jgi:hypothetical protein
MGGAFVIGKHRARTVASTATMMNRQNNGLFKIPFAAEPSSIIVFLSMMIVD